MEQEQTEQEQMEQEQMEQEQTEQEQMEQLEQELMEQQQMEQEQAEQEQMEQEQLEQEQKQPEQEQERQAACPAPPRCSTERREPPGAGLQPCNAGRHGPSGHTESSGAWRHPRGRTADQQEPPADHEAE